MEARRDPPKFSLIKMSLWEFMGMNHMTNASIKLLFHAARAHKCWHTQPSWMDVKITFALPSIISKIHHLLLVPTERKTFAFIRYANKFLIFSSNMVIFLLVNGCWYTISPSCFAHKLPKLRKDEENSYFIKNIENYR